MGENLNIQSSEISIDKKSRLTILKGKVIARDYKNKTNTSIHIMTNKKITANSNIDLRLTLESDR